MPVYKRICMNTINGTNSRASDTLSEEAPRSLDSTSSPGLADTGDELSRNDVDRFESFRNHITAEHQQAPSEASGYPEFLIESRLTVSASWMRSSFENAQRALPIQDFPIKGFRPGKAPKQLIEKQRRERAIELARGWIVEDLRRFLGELVDVFVIGSIGRPVTLEWPKPDSPLSATFRFEGWLYPHLDIDALCRHLQGAEPHSPTFPDQVYEYISSTLIPPGIETALMQAEGLREALPVDVAQARQHLRQALANNLLAYGLDIVISEADIDRGYGEYAIQHSLSLLEAKEELEPMFGVFVQKIETEKAYAALREMLKR